MKTTNCQSCGIEVRCERRTKKWCSQKCYVRHRNGYPKNRQCLECGEAFQVLTQQADANKKYCSYRCSKNANSKRVKRWVGDHPDAVKNYNSRRIEKHPGAWKDKAARERLKALTLLGGRCVVCGVNNPNWLHVDYIPTTRGQSGRHPRHLAYIRRHPENFRILCANHHHELTITRKIEGTDITQ